MKSLRCNETKRDKQNLSALVFYFNRRVTDKELRFLDEVMKRSAFLVEEE